MQREKVENKETITNNIWTARPVHSAIFVLTLA